VGTYANRGLFVNLARWERELPGAALGKQILVHESVSVGNRRAEFIAPKPVRNL
jgi:hypothetical protein